MIVRPRRQPGPLVAAAVFAVLAWGGTARAQMQLPGATNGVAGGTPPAGGPSGKTPASAPAAPAKPIVIKPPGVDTIVGHVLAHDGSSGSMGFDKVGDDLVVSKLAFTGTKLSKPTQGCSIDVTLAHPLVATEAGRPEGALRYKIPLEACQFSIDVLDGAVLVTDAEPTCDFVAADCKVSPGGLWGPSPADISPQRAKELEHERVRIETTMRADFRALLKRAGKDKAAVKAIAADQAGFSSDREVTCRDYAQESIHGFCSAQITEARVLALLAKFGDEPKEKPARGRQIRAKASITMPAPVAVPAR